MRLISLSQFREDFFEKGSRPQIRTLRRACETDSLPARRIGGRWFVDADKFRQESADKEVVDRVVNG